MNNAKRLLIAATLLIVAVALLALPRGSATGSQDMAGMQHSADANEAVPAFHADPPKDTLPQTMEPSLFQDILIFNAYAVAGRVEKVLYQQPCYCHCDKAHGHGSLLDCFVSKHGSGCGICQKEVFYSYEQTHRGKTPAQIRDGIIRGDWNKVDLAKYKKAYLPPANTLSN